MIPTNQVVSDRTPRPLDGHVLPFDLEEETHALLDEETWRATGHNARTLVKNDEVRIVLVVLRAGARVAEHETYHRAAVQMLAGRVRLQLPDETIELTPPSLVAIGDAMPRCIEAMEDSSLLIILGWSRDKRSSAI